MSDERRTPKPEQGEIAKIHEAERGVYFAPVDQVSPSEMPAMDALAPVNSAPAVPSQDTAAPDAPVAPEQ